MTRRLVRDYRTEARAYAPSHALVIYQKTRSSWWLVGLGVLLVIWGLGT